MAFMSKAAAAVIFAVGASGAQAATTHVFNLSKYNSSVESIDQSSFSVNGGLTESGETFTGTFTGFFADTPVVVDSTITGGTFGGAEELKLVRYNNGAGVCRTGECVTGYYAEGEPHSTDNATDDIFDYIEMAFYAGGDLVDVTLTGLTFGWIGEWRYGGKPYGVEGATGAFDIILDVLDGEGDLGIGIGDLLAYSGTVIPGDSYNSRGSVDLSGASLLDSIFGVKAGDGGSWKLLTVTVEYDETSPEPPDTPPPPVPLPGAIWLLLAGLGGLAIVKRGGQA